MAALEKLLFIDATRYQTGNYNESEYLATWKFLTDEEKETHRVVHVQMHWIWTYINSQRMEGAVHESIDSIQDYHDRIEPVHERIWKLHDDFGITLKKDPLSENFKKALRLFLGEDFYQDFMSKQKE